MSGFISDLPFHSPSPKEHAGQPPLYSAVSLQRAHHTRADCSNATPPNRNANPAATPTPTKKWPVETHNAIPAPIPSMTPTAHRYTSISPVGPPFPLRTDSPLQSLYIRCCPSPLLAQSVAVPVRCCPSPLLSQKPSLAIRGIRIKLPYLVTLMAVWHRLCYGFSCGKAALPKPIDWKVHHEPITAEYLLPAERA